MPARLRLVVALLVPALLFTAGPAVASLGGDVAAGRRLSEQVQTGSSRCDRLGRADFEQLGEYAMERMTGSRPVHMALDSRMAGMMGAAAAERVHELMGRRVAGCVPAGADTGWSWMRAGAWRHMSAADWGRVRADGMGPAMMSGTREGWSAIAVAAVATGALLAGGLLVLVARRRRQPTHG